MPDVPFGPSLERISRDADGSEVEPGGVLPFSLRKRNDMSPHGGLDGDGALEGVDARRLGRESKRTAAASAISYNHPEGARTVLTGSCE